jgi:cell division protein FtsB
MITSEKAISDQLEAAIARLKMRSEQLTIHIKELRHGSKAELAADQKLLDEMRGEIEQLGRLRGALSAREKNLLIN